MRGQASFDGAALKRIRTTMPRTDRGRPGLSLDELADRVGTSRRQLIRYEKGQATPEPARIARLASALDCDVRELTGADPDQVDLAVLRRGAGLTLRAAAARLRPLLARPRLRCSDWLLGEAEAGRLPAAWRPPENRTRLVAALASVYQQPTDRVDVAVPAIPAPVVVEKALEPVAAAAPEAVTAYPLIQRAVDTWYARCPNCELVASPSSVSHRMHADRSVDWSVPATLRCSQCGTEHQVTPDDLLPHDSFITCPRPSCGQITQVPAEAVEVVCEHCGLCPPGPAALVDPELDNLAKHIRYGHTRTMQAAVRAAKARNAALGGPPPFLLGPGDH
ncbi:helix-turn-helix domain-containing protein [Amycolatopsis sp. NPDC004378]